MSQPNQVVTVLRRQSHMIGLENVGEHNFGHITITAPWTPRLRRLVREDIDRLMALTCAPLHAMTIETAPDAVRLHAKFVAQMGFTFNTMVPCQDGIERAVYTRSYECP